MRVTTAFDNHLGLPGVTVSAVRFEPGSGQVKVGVRLRPRKLAITVEPLRELAATHRRQLDDEVELVARSWRPSRPLTVGTVTVGPHA